MTHDLETYCKLITFDIISYRIACCREKIQKELYQKAIDPILLKRRARMLSQVADYESQIYKKIYNFQGDDVSDYALAIQLVTNDLRNVINPSS